MGRTAAVVGTATVVHGAVQGHQQDKAQTQADADAYNQQQAAAQPAPPPPAYAPPAPAYQPPPSSTSTMLDQLKELGELKASGVLTQDEFDAQKAKLLNA